LHVWTLTPSYPSAGGIAEGCCVSEPLNWLAKSGVRNTLVAARPVYRRQPDSDIPAVVGEWIRYLSLPGGVGIPFAGAFLFARVLGRLRELHRTDGVDLLHAHGVLPCGHAAMLLSKELNIPYVVTVYGHDDLSAAQVSGRRGKWCHRLMRRIFAESRRVVCISEHVREYVLESMGRGFRTSVVYNGVDAELFSPALESPKPTTTVLSAGNLRTLEGHDVLIRAAAPLVKEFPSLTLEVIGDGRERPHLEKLAKETGLAGRVRFVERQSPRQIADAMKRCTLFALPSQADSSGCLHVQAMSCGKTVIGCRGQGTAEIIQHGTNGFLVGPGNEKELTLAMGILLREPQRRHNLGMAARDSILERFTLEQQAESLARIYRESVASEGREL
jgi:teichuronic acid biosynthesis glycosyltransferase TuaC